MGIKLKQRPVPSEVLGAGPVDWQVRLYETRMDGRSYTVLVSRDEISPGDLRHHLSVCGQDGQLPEWRHLAALAHEIRPGVPFCIAIPPKSWWINLHEYVLHVFEVKDDNLIAQWRSERQGDTPT